jgi:hypothetical protein
VAANGITDVEANRILDNSVATGSTVDLVTTMGTATTAPTKVTGGSYAAQTPTWSAASARTKSNSATVNFTGLPAATVVGIDVSNTTPARSWFIPLTTTKTVGAGDTLSFASAAISFSFANGT